MELTKEHLLEIVKKSYSSADDYSCWEDAKLIYARALNDSPMQHGDGVWASWHKEKHILVVRRYAAHRREFILTEINKILAS